MYRTFVVLLVLPALSPAEEKIDSARGEEQAQVIAKAVLEGDFGKVADGTHPKVVELMGGREKMITATKAIMDTLKDQGITITSHKLGKPLAPVVDGKTAYMVIPSTTVMKSDELTITIESYLLGLTTDSGKNWVFVDGSGMDQKEVKDMIFPKLPAGLKLPEKKEPTVIQNKN